MAIAIRPTCIEENPGFRDGSHTYDSILRSDDATVKFKKHPETLSYDCEQVEHPPLLPLPELPTHPA